jgi:transposase-like protein
MPMCPNCGSGNSILLKEWEYAAFHVKAFECKKCQKMFREYYYKGKLSHTIMPTFHPPKKRTAIVKYLMTHKEASVDEIANELNIPSDVVLKELLALEKLGAVGRFRQLT